MISELIGAFEDPLGAAYLTGIMVSAAGLLFESVVVVGLGTVLWVLAVLIAVVIAYAK